MWNLFLLLFFPSQLHLQACCTSVSLTCPTTASITSSMVYWRTSTSYGSSRWRTTLGSVTTTSTTWSTGSSTTLASSTLAWSALRHGSSGAGASRITSRPTTGNVQRIDKLKRWIRDRVDKGGQTMRHRRWWGRRLRVGVAVCLSTWKRKNPTGLKSSGWVRMVVDQRTVWFGGLCWTSVDRLMDGLIKVVAVIWGLNQMWHI